MHNHTKHTTNLCPSEVRYAPDLLLAHTQSFSSDSQSPYYTYGFFAILKNNSVSALKCVGVSTKKAVESLWTGCVREFYNCAKNVYNKDFMHLASDQFFSYAQLLHMNYTQLMNNILPALTPVKESYTHYPHSLLKLYIYIKENK